jgi:hypothetical protein
LPSFSPRKKFFSPRTKKSFNVVLVLPRSLQALVDVLLSESSSRLPAVSRQSLATSASSYLAVAVAPCRFRGNSPIEPRASHEVIHRFIHRFHPLRYFCILHSIVAPLVLKRGITFPIHRPSVSKVHRQIHSIESPSHPSSHPPVNPRRLSPTSPQRGDSLSDSCFILGPTTSWSSSPLHRVFSSHSSNHPISQSSLSLSLPYKSSKGG